VYDNFCCQVAWERRMRKCIGFDGFPFPWASPSIIQGNNARIPRSIVNVTCGEKCLSGTITSNRHANRHTIHNPPRHYYPPPPSPFPSPPLLLPPAIQHPPPPPPPITPPSNPSTTPSTHISSPPSHPTP